MLQPKPIAPNAYTDDWIETAGGRQFWYNHPTFDITEMGHTLGLICRFGGHCRRFYSVAEHSILVALLMSKLDLGDPYEGLMHDAHEAYVIDVPRPMKNHLPQYKTMEVRVEKAMRKYFHLPEKPSEGVKMADAVALVIEAKQLMPSKGSTWSWGPGVRELATKCMDLKLNCWESHIARDHFLATYRELSVMALADRIQL